MRRHSCLLIVALLAASGLNADDAPSLPQPVQDATAAVVAVFAAKDELQKGETFRQRWHRLRKERFGAMNQQGDGSFGAGFIVDPEGHVLTSVGLLDKVERLEVLTREGRHFQAKVVAQDPRNGVALLKLEGADPFPFLTLSESEVVPGTRAFSLGNAFESMTKDRIVAIGQGRVTSCYTLIGDEAGYEGPAIETDAATNPGLYGGPLLDAAGKVIGVLTSSTGEGRCAGVAIPARQIAAILPALRKGEARKPYLGIFVLPVAADGRGVPVEGLADESAAGRAGLVPGARILSLNGLPTNDAMALKKALMRFPPQAELELEVEVEAVRRLLRLRPGAVPEKGVKGL